MVSTGKYVCIPCREVFGMTWQCPRCGESMKGVNYRWRPPKKNNDTAWKLVEAGDWLWDKKHLEKLNKRQQDALAWRYNRRREDYFALTEKIKFINSLLSMEDMAKILNTDVKRVKRWLNGGGVTNRKVEWRIVELHKLAEFINDADRLKSLVPQVRDIFWKRRGRSYRPQTYMIMEDLGMLAEWRARPDNPFSAWKEERGLA